MIRYGMPKRLAFLRQQEEERQQTKQLEEQIRTYPLPIQSILLTHQQMYGNGSTTDMLSLAARLTGIYAQRGFIQAQTDQASLLIEGVGMQHLIIDLYHCQQVDLENASLLRTLLECLPDEIRMQRVSPVTLEYIETSDPQDVGLSGFVIIATSHISLHAWPSYGMVNLDLFSCEPFDTHKTIQYVQETFHVHDEETEVQSIHRALRSLRTQLKKRGQL